MAQPMGAALEGEGRGAELLPAARGGEASGKGRGLGGGAANGRGARGSGAWRGRLSGCALAAPSFRSRRRQRRPVVPTLRLSAPPLRSLPAALPVSPP